MYYVTQIQFATPEFDEAVKLRYKILRLPLKMDFEAEDIAQEYDSNHLACYATESNDLLGVLILKDLGNGVAKMRQVAVNDANQSTGVGRFLVTESEKFALRSGFHKIELNARDTAIPFYQKLGYTSEGPVFQEVGIDHLYMFKMIKS